MSQIENDFHEIKILLKRNTHFFCNEEEVHQALCYLEGLLSYAKDEPIIDRMKFIKFKEHLDLIQGYFGKFSKKNSDNLKTRISELNLPNFKEEPLSFDKYKEQ